MSQTIRHLTAFQRDLLYIICDLDNPYGLGIKSRVEEYYEEEVNTGRVYQNLNKLAEDDLLEKSEVNKRTKSYNLTDEAIEAMQRRHRWQGRQIDTERIDSPPQD